MFFKLVSDFCWQLYSTEVFAGAVPFLRTLIFTPVVMSSVAVGLVWQMLLNPQLGVIVNPLLESVGIAPPSLGWLGDPTLAIYGVLLVACWQYTGYMMILLLAGIQSVPGELYEAATLDGASERQSFWHITLPGIRKVLLTATLITMIGAFKVFDLVYILTGGGPANASQVLGTYLYNQAFTQARMGYACAIAVVLLVFAMSLSVVQLRLGRRRGGNMRFRWRVFLYLLSWSLRSCTRSTPILWMAGSSLKSIVEMLTQPFQLPAEPQWGNFPEAWQRGVSSYSTQLGFSYEAFPYSASCWSAGWPPTRSPD